MSCGHVFHKACVQELADKSRPCPTCRAEVRWKDRDHRYRRTPTRIGAPQIWDRQKGVSPVCPDLFRFLPICSDLRSLFAAIPRFAPISSDLLRFVPICFQNKSGKHLSADPFCKSPTAAPKIDCSSLPSCQFLKGSPKTSVIREI